MRSLFTFLLGICFLVVGLAQDGTPDATFGNNGTKEINLTGTQDWASVVKSNASGRILVVAVPGNQQGNLIIALSEDGSLDTDFGIDGVLSFEYNGQPKQIMKLLLFEDDSFLVLFESGSLMFAKYLPGGDLDTSFGNQGYVSITNSMNSVSNLTQVGDRWLLVGYSNIAGLYHVKVSRYLLDGSLDATYGNAGNVTHIINQTGISQLKFSIDQQQHITVVGMFKEDDFQQIILTRLLENGAVDTDFGEEGFSIQPYQPINNSLSLSLQFVRLQDGNYLMTVTEVDIDEEITKFYFIKFNAQGERLMDFGNDGRKYGGGYGVFKLVLQPNGRVFILGNSYQFEGVSYFLGRFFPNGVYDNSFTLQFNSQDFYGADLILQPDGKGLILSYSVWLEPDGWIHLERFLNNPLSLPVHPAGRWVIYPNPSSQEVYLENTLWNHVPITYVLYDVTGKILRTGVLSSATTTLDVSGLATGVYILAAGQERFRLVKN